MNSFSSHVKSVKVLSGFLLLSILLLASLDVRSQSESDTIPEVKQSAEVWENLHKGLYLDLATEFVPGPSEQNLSNSVELGITVSVFDIAFFFNNVNSNYNAELIFPNTFDLDYIYGGVHLGTKLMATKRIMIKPSINLGRGDMTWSRQDEDKVFSRDVFKIVHPQIRLGYSPIRFITIYGKSGYRFLNGLNLNGVSSEDFEGFTFGIGLSLYLTNE